MRRNEAVITEQTTLLNQTLSKLLPKGGNYAFLDFPPYSNVGDSALWLGGLRLLSQTAGRMPGHVSTIEKFDADRLMRSVPNGPIFLSGGGNFGDIWPWFQEFREMVIDRFKDRVIVQLPQSISFRDELAVSRCAKVIERNANFHLLVRDHPSFEFAQRHFQCPTELVPDMAFGLGALERPIAPSHDVFMLLREDSERADYDRSPLFEIHNAIFADWIDEPENFDDKSKYISIIKALVTGSWGPEERRLVYYQQLATGRLNRGLRMLSSGKHVVTDRLHGHILSTLLDIPHVALDNNYGKVSGYINAWTKNYPGVQVATTAKEALEKLELLPD